MDDVFCRLISARSEPFTYEDDLVVVVPSAEPQHEVHLLVIPRDHIESAGHIRSEHGAVLVRMFQVASEVAPRAGYVAAFNVGSYATVPHLHLHVTTP